jgi:hypothetical protein
VVSPALQPQFVGSALVFSSAQCYNLAQSNAKEIDRMIPRYSRPEMSAIWSEESKFQIWFEIEAHACDAQAALGVIPAEAAKTGLGKRCLRH